MRTEARTDAALQNNLKEQLAWAEQVTNVHALMMSVQSLYSVALTSRCVLVLMMDYRRPRTYCNNVSISTSLARIWTVERLTNSRTCCQMYY